MPGHNKAATAEEKNHEKTKSQGNIKKLQQLKKTHGKVRKPRKSHSETKKKPIKTKCFKGIFCGIRFQANVKIWILSNNSRVKSNNGIPLLLTVKFVKKANFRIVCKASL